MYVGMTRARQKLVISHALQRTLFGNTASFIPSSFLADIPTELVESMGSEREISTTTYSRPKERTSWAGAINAPAAVRDNKDLSLEVGDKINHDSFGAGRVISVTGTPPKQTAEIRFDNGTTKRLLVKMAPITRL